MDAREEKPSALTAFKRSQIAAFVSSVFDFSTLIFLVEALDVWYVAATALGAFGGAVLNFLLNRYWTFEASEGKLHFQALKYSFVSGLSLVLNSSGVYVFTDYAGTPYAVSKLLTSVLVGIFFNFPMHRYYVFRGGEVTSRVAEA